MANFMDENFLLKTRTAERLFHEYANKMPIIDYHCHIGVKEIASDMLYDNLAQLWLGGDHYKWRAMRSNGIDERYITGDASDYEKFAAWAQTVPGLIGSPLYHWTHLELKRYFDINIPLDKNTCAEIWEHSLKVLKTLSVKRIIGMSNVDILCSTDDPSDNLEFHKAVKKDGAFKTKIYPAFRPDKAINIESPDFSSYIKILSGSGKTPVTDFSSLKAALNSRMDFFAENGCRASDHGINYIPFHILDENEADAVMKKRLRGETLSKIESDGYKTALLLHLAREYHKRGWVMEIHYGVYRNANTRMYNELGPDAGYDAVAGSAGASDMIRFFDRLENEGTLPKILLFSIHPSDNIIVNTVLGCFQSPSAICKLQQGSAWWFNDTKAGMEEQLISFANASVLANFVGFLTDSRSFLSYSRHEYFRRILCNMIGGLVEDGEYPNDMETLSGIVRDISYYNALRYFDFGR